MLELFIFVVLTTTPTGKVNGVTVIGPYHDYSTCVILREKYEKHVPLPHGLYDKSPCVQLPTQQLPRCLQERSPHEKSVFNSRRVVALTPVPDFGISRTKGLLP